MWVSPMAWMAGATVTGTYLRCGRVEKQEVALQVRALAELPVQLIVNCSFPLNRLVK